jgi:hypothetical protein
MLKALEIAAMSFEIVVARNAGQQSLASISPMKT